MILSLRRLAIVLNLSQLNSYIQESFSETVDRFAQRCQDNLEAERWEWERITRRKNGQVVATPRDIVDTGYLRDSQQIETNHLSATVAYTADYAEHVHEGSNKGHLPRPWVKVTAEEEDLTFEFSDRLRKKLQ